MRLCAIHHAETTHAAIYLGGEEYALVVDASGTSLADVGALLRERRWRDLAASAEHSGQRVRGATLAQPVVPDAVICVGVNYRAHVAEMGATLPEYPTLFSKLPRALVGPNVPVELPAGAAEAVDYEGEFALVIGSGGRDIALERAWEAVAGVTLANDVSMRDFQMRTQQWFAGKTWERSTPVGPVVVTTDELAGFEEQEIIVAVNGEQRQRAVVGELVFSVPELVSYISQIVELRPGDLILSGTPAGVGFASQPPAFLRDGDVVEVSIHGIGTLRTPFHQGSFDRTDSAPVPSSSSVTE